MHAAGVVPDNDWGPDDAELVRRVYTNPAEFELLYDRYRDQVYRYLRTCVAQDADADDLTQHVFLRALGQIQKYDQQRGTFASWLFAIARHSASDFRRRRRRVVSVDDERWLASDVLCADSAEREVMRRDEVAFLHRALATLSPDKRELLALRFAAGLTIPEIAAVIGKSSEATRKQLRRTIQCLEEYYREASR